MRVSMLLCDAASAVDGKLYVLGGGWTDILTSGQPVSMALGIVVSVPWDQANMRHPLQVQLRTADDDVVSMGDRAVEAEGVVEVGRPAGVKPGTDLNAVMAFQFQGLQVAPGGYEWRLIIGNKDRARIPFRVRPLQGGDA